MDFQKLIDIHKVLNFNETDNGQVAIDQKLTRLTAPGENYGSLILSLEIVLKNKDNGKEKILKTVAKMIPPNEFLQNIFNVQVTFRNEIKFYMEIVPILQNFQNTYGMTEMNYFPNCYGARLNLNGGKVVDGNGVLLLENLKLSGYTMIDRLKGFDLFTTKFIIRELANFHASSLALKLTHREIFESKIKKHLAGFKIHHKELQKTIEEWEVLLEENEDLKYLLPLVMEKLKKGPTKNSREPFVTLIHNDLWVNNIMVKLENNEVSGVKFIDFQLCDYRSPISDLLFFLFTSVPIEILQRHLDNFLRCYYEHLTFTFKRLNVDHALFPFEQFLEDIRVEVSNEVFFHLAFMVPIVFADNQSVKELTDINIENGILGKTNNNQKERMAFCVKEFSKRGWMV